MPWTRQHLRWIPVVSIVILVTFAIALLSLGRVLFVPLTLAIILSFLLHPLVHLLQAARFGRVPAVITVVMLVGVVLAGLTWHVAGQLQQLVHQLHTNESYFHNLQDKVSVLRGVGSDGFLADFQATVNQFSGELQVESPTGESAEPTVVVRDEPQSAWRTLSLAVGPLLEPLGIAALVIALMIFMLIGREDLRNRLIGLVGHSHLSVTTRAINDAARRIGRYLLMQFVINATYGVALGAMLWALGMPFWFLWGLLGGLLRYIPYVGPWIGAAFPVLVSLVVFPGWVQPLMVFGIIVVLELCSNMIMEPLLYGHSVGISPVALILSAVFWTWLWGPIGLVLATPLTVCLVVVGQHVPELRSLALLLGDEPALPPPIRYYQRLLARDHDEAQRMIENFVEDEGDICEALDQVLVPALVRSRQDRHRDELSADDEAFLRQATWQIVQKVTSGSFSSDSDPSSHSPLGFSSFAPQSTAGEGERRTSPLVLGCPSHHETEELVLQMFGRMIADDGYHVEVASRRILFSDVAERIKSQNPAIVFIAVVPPSGLSQAGYLCEQLREAFPDLAILVGYWGDKGRFDDVLVQLRSKGANWVTTSLSQAQQQVFSTVERLPRLRSEPRDSRVAEKEAASCPES